MQTVGACVGASDGRCCDSGAGAATNRRQCAALARYAQAQDESGGDNGFVRGRSAVAHTLSAMYSNCSVYGNPVTYFSFIAVARFAFPRTCVVRQTIDGESW